jgi:hypothetical protein
MQRPGSLKEINMGLRDWFKPMPWGQSIAFSLVAAAIVFLLIYYLQ